ncbi:MAG: ankyrin repeat domain-containing protein, partial [Moorea sp. SIO4G2]|nr:ankyrin repeat domain-containing protein [Moorena sp. SIO4G2]
MNAQLIEAAKRGDTKTLGLLLENVTNIDGKDNLFGRTVLMWAAREGQTKTLQVLLEKGAEVNGIDKYGGTALQA